MLVDGEIASEFDEVVRFGCAAHSPDVELFHAAILRKTFPTHVHDGFVIGLVLRGVQAFNYRGTKYRAGPGDLILLNPDSPHTAQTGSPDCVEYCTLQIPTSLMADYANRDFFFDEPVLNALSGSNKFLQYFSMLQVTKDAAIAQNELDTIISEVLTITRPKFFDQSARISAIDRWMRDVGKQISTSLEDNVTVSSLADAAGFSRFHFLRVFKNNFGVAPHAYIQAIRTATAKRLIASGISPVHAAMSTGFVDQSHLTRWMRNCYGVTPGAYRALISPHLTDK